MDSVIDDDRITAFLTRLCETPRGAVLAVSMLESAHASPAWAVMLREFLRDCAAAYDPQRPPAHCVDIVVEVSVGEGTARRSYLRHDRQPCVEADGRHMVSNVVKTETFRQFVLSDSYKSDAALPEVLPPRPLPTPEALDAYAELLAELVSAGGWCGEKATLGRPPHSNCWLSTDRFGADADSPSYQEEATRARDELGLADYRQGACLIRFQIPESALAGLPDLELARPAFADLGNSRFRVVQHSGRAQQFARAGWGATVHLGKLRSRHADLTGVPERVASPVPLGRIPQVEVRFLGRVSTHPHDRPDELADEDFLAWVLATRTGRHIYEEVCQIVAGSSSP